MVIFSHDPSCRGSKPRSPQNEINLGLGFKCIIFIWIVKWPDVVPFGLVLLLQAHLLIWLNGFNNDLYKNYWYIHVHVYTKYRCPDLFSLSH